MSKSILISAPLLLGFLSAAPPPEALPGTPELVFKASEHQKVGKLMADCIEAYVKKEGRRDAEAELRKVFEKKWDKEVEGHEALALTEDLGAALWYAADYSKAKGVKKGKIAEFEVAIPYYGTYKTDRKGEKVSVPYMATYALWAPSKYNAKSGPYPLIICIPEVDEKPEDHLRDHWSEGDLQDGAIVVALGMPEKTENWGTSGGAGDPGGFGILFSAFVDVRDRYAIDFDKVFLAGRGLGVKVAMEIANASPDRFAGVIGRTGDAAEIAPDNFSNLPCYFAGGGSNATAFAEKAKELGMVQPILNPDAKEKEIWDWIQATTRRSNPEEVVLLPGAPMPNKAYWLEIPPHDGQTVARMKAKADRASNTVTIDSEGIAKVTLYLNDVLLDLDQKVKVVLNGVEQEVLIPRNFNTMMEQIYRGRSDPGKIYTASKDFDIPASK